MSYCRLEDEITVKELLKSFGLSQQAIKKSEFKKKFLDKKIREREEIDLSLNLLNRGMINPSYKGPKPTILQETEDYLALSKPSFIHCHPLSYLENDNLLSFLRSENYTDYLRVNEGNYDRGLLYRLDYETSGLILLTKNPNKYEQARKGELLGNKTYYALVEGQYSGPERLIHNVSTSGKKVKQDDYGKVVNLHVHSRHYEEAKNRTLLKVSIKEGVRHQIRIQLSLSGHPIWGDVLYGAEERKNEFGLYCFSYELEGKVFEDTSLNLNF